MFVYIPLVAVTMVTMFANKWIYSSYKRLKASVIMYVGFETHIYCRR